MSRAARLGAMWASGGQRIPLSEFAQGAIVKLNEDGIAKEFLVAKQGYPTAGNGRTLLLRKWLIENRQWHTSNVNAYATSAINTWLNGTYYNKFDADIQSLIAEVSIPYTPGNGSWTVGSLSRRVFLLSYTEVGFSGDSYVNVEGSNLGLFANNSARRGYLESAQSTAAVWWLRSPRTNINSHAHPVDEYGYAGSVTVSSSLGIRPAFTLPSDTLVNANGNIMA